MSNDDKILSLLENLTSKFDRMESRQDRTESMLDTLIQVQTNTAVHLERLEIDLSDVKQEQKQTSLQLDKIGHKLDSVFNHAATLTENDTVINQKLDRIEKEVSKHDEVIFRKVE